MVYCIRGLGDIARFRSYRKYKPVCTIKEDARAWWLYAISCHYPDRLPDICKPRPSWESCLQRAQENVQYVRTYTKVLISPNLAITPEEKQIKDTVEWSRDFEELKVLREVSKLILIKSNLQLNYCSCVCNQFHRKVRMEVTKVQRDVVCWSDGFHNGWVGILLQQLTILHQIQKRHNWKVKF